MSSWTRALAAHGRCPGVVHDARALRTPAGDAGPPRQAQVILETGRVGTAVGSSPRPRSGCGLTSTPAAGSISATCRFCHGLPTCGRRRRRALRLGADFDHSGLVDSAIWPISMNFLRSRGDASQEPIPVASQRLAAGGAGGQCAAVDEAVLRPLATHRCPTSADRR